MRSKSSVTAPATCFECYDGTGSEMGGRRFQRWIGCILCPLKKSSNFLSVIGSRQILYLGFLFEQSYLVKVRDVTKSSNEGHILF
jgi:hypothetical protein